MIQHLALYRQQVSLAGMARRLGGTCRVRQIGMRFSLGYFLFSGADSLYLINFSGARDLRFKACKAGRIRLLQPFTHCRANVAGRVSDGARQSVDRRMICQMVGVL